MDILLRWYGENSETITHTTLDALSAPARSRHLDEALAKAVEIVVVGESIPRELLDGSPSLRARVARGEVNVLLRSVQEQDDLEAREEASRHKLSEEARRALTSARRRQPETAPAHPHAERLSAPAISPSDLQNEEPERQTGESGRPLLGPLAPKVGPRIEAQEILQGDELEELDLPAAERVRAWRLPSLVGQIIVVPSIDEMAGAIRAWLRENLGDLPFAVRDQGYGGPGKYLHMHASVLAPPDGDEPMAIELYGQIVAFGDMDIDSLAAGRLILAHQQRMFALSTRRSSADGEAARDNEATASLDNWVAGRELPVPLYISIRSATYANVLFCGVGVPFYM